MQTNTLETNLDIQTPPANYIPRCFGALKKIYSVVESVDIFLLKSLRLDVSDELEIDKGTSFVNPKLLLEYSIDSAADEASKVIEKYIIDCRQILYAAQDAEHIDDLFARITEKAIDVCSELQIAEPGIAVSKDNLTNIMIDIMKARTLKNHGYGCSITSGSHNCRFI